MSSDEHRSNYLEWGISRGDGKDGVAGINAVAAAVSGCRKFRL